jgi:hypothetical protein
MGGCISCSVSDTQLSLTISRPVLSVGPSSQSTGDGVQPTAVSNPGRVSYAAAVGHNNNKNQAPHPQSSPHPQPGLYPQQPAVLQAVHASVTSPAGGTDYELVLKASKELEWMLETFLNATGKGLHENAASATFRGQELPLWLQKKMFWLSAMRNKLVHERGVDRLTVDRSEFMEAYHKCDAELVGYCRQVEPNFDAVRARPPVIHDDRDRDRNRDHRPHNGPYGGGHDDNHRRDGNNHNSNNGGRTPNQGQGYHR